MKEKEIAMENKELNKLETTIQKPNAHCPNCLEPIDNSLWKIRQIELEREKRIKRLLDQAWEKVDQDSIVYEYHWVNGKDNHNPYDGTRFEFKYLFKRNLNDWLDCLDKEYQLDYSYNENYRAKLKSHEEFIKKYPTPQEAFNYFEGNRIRGWINENLFNTPCVNCKLPSLTTATTYVDDQEIKHKWTIDCVVCHQSYSPDFKLDQDLDSDYNDGFRLYELYKHTLVGLKDSLESIEAEISEKEAERNQYLTKISARSRFVESYEKQQKNHGN